MRERDIEKILVGEVKRMGGRAYKWVSPGRKGSVWPCRRKGIPGGARREDTWNLSRTHTSSTALTGLSK